MDLDGEDVREDVRDDAARRWLCRTEMERARFIDMNARVRTARRVQGLALCVASVAAAPVYGWWIVGLVTAAATTLIVMERVPQRQVSLERASATSIVVFILILGIAVMGTGGVRSPFLVFLAVPTLMVAARFRTAVVACGIALSSAVAGAAMLAALALPEVGPTPWWVSLAVYAALMIGLSATSVTLLGAEMQSRGDAVVDPLTGLFNRKALAGRYAEAAAQSRVLGGALSVVLCDLDHFKRVNDQYGHDRGDIVLREAAYRIRRTLRTFDLVYRIGGEEFVVLLPGQDEESAAAVAERLVADLAAEAVGGLAVTMSAGVAGTAKGEIDLGAILKRADLALYAAKHAGRNRVRRFEARWGLCSPEAARLTFGRPVSAARSE